MCRKLYSSKLTFKAEGLESGSNTVLQALQNSVKQGQEWNKVCVESLPLATAAKGTGARLAALPFTSKDLTEYAKATATLQKQIRADLKEKKEEAKREGSAEAEGADTLDQSK